MPAYTLEIMLVLVVVAGACALPGVFLVLRRTALVSDAIGHVLLFGIVLAYFVVRDQDSPWLLAGAAAAGVLTTALVGLLQRTQLVKEDAAVGLVFPALFAGGVLLASMYLRNTHLDVDAVLLGQPELAAEERWRIGGVWVKPLWGIVTVFGLNAVLLILFYKELKLTTFDPGLGAVVGFRPGAVHYGLMLVVSVTAVAAFDAVGPVLVVGFFIVPAAAALLLSDRLGVVLGLAVLLGAIGAAGGTYLAIQLQTNTAGMVAVVLGLLFAGVFVAAPSRGLVAQTVRRFQQARTFAETMLAVHLYQHENTPQEADESRMSGLHHHLSWSSGQIEAVVRRAERHGLVVRVGERLRLTAAGRERVRGVLGGPPERE